MAHEMIMNISTNFVLNKDVEVEVKTDGRKIGTLLISRGNVEWMPAGNSVNKKRLSWSKFAELMVERGRDVRVNKI